MIKFSTKSRALALLLVVTMIFVTAPMGSFTTEAAIPAPAEPTVAIIAGLKAIQTIAVVSFYFIKGVTAATDAASAMVKEDASIMEAANVAIYSFIGKTYDPYGDKTPLYRNDYINTVKELKNDLLAEFDNVNSNITAVSDKIDDVANEEYITNFLLQYNGGYVNLAKEMMKEYKDLSDGFSLGFATSDELKTAYDQLYESSVKLENHLSYFMTTGVLSGGKMTTIQELLYNAYGTGCYEYVRFLYETYLLSQYFIQLCSMYQMNYCGQTGTNSYTVKGFDDFFAISIPGKMVDYANNFDTVTLKLAKFFSNLEGNINVNVNGTGHYTVIPISDNIQVCVKDIVQLPSFGYFAGSLFDSSKLYYEISGTGSAEVSEDGRLKIMGANEKTVTVKARYDATKADKDNVCYTLNFTTKASGFSGGIGTETHPYLVTTANEFKSIFQSKYASSHFFLGNDIDMNGSSISYLSSFYGSINGNGYAVYKFDAFDIIHENYGTIKNLTLGKSGTANITTLTGTCYESNGTTYNEGILVSKNYGTITDCTMQNFVITLNAEETDNDKTFTLNLGALVGINKGKITNCVIRNTFVTLNAYANSASGDDITGYAGAFAAVNESDGTISGCVLRASDVTSSVNVYGGKLNKSVPTSYAGGIAGANKGTISSCATYGGGQVTTTAAGTNYKNATSCPGKICGSNSATITKCYASGTSPDVLCHGTATTSSARFESDADMSRRISVSDPLYKDSNGMPMPNFITGSEVVTAQHNYGTLNKNGFNAAGITFVVKMKSGAEIEAKHFKIASTDNTEVGDKEITVTYGASTSATFTVNIPCPHKIKSIYSEKMPSCFENGHTESVYCQVCETWLVEEIVRPQYGSHSFGDYISVSTSTHKRTCLMCGHLEQTVHTWDGGEVIIPSTHTTTGTVKYTCTLCSQTKTESLPTVDGHSYGEWKNYSDDTHARECACGAVQYNTHTWNAGEITTQPTHLKEGTKKYTCTGCGATKTESVPTLTAHSYGEWKNYSADNHVRECPCGTVEYSNHTWNTGEITVQPTHLKEGTKTYTCTGCSATKTESVPTLTAHSYGEWKNYSADKHVRECPCGTVEYADHTWNAGEITAQPTHMKEGTKTYTCTGCSATKTESVPTLTAHSYGEWKNYSDDKHVRECPCGTVEYADHTWNSGEITAQPTHLKEGSKKYTCTGCGATKTETLPKTEAHEYSPWKNYSELIHNRECGCGAVEYANHTWGDGIPTKLPTHTEVGETMYVCGQCNATKTEAIDKLPEHNYVYSVVTAPTATASGTGKYTCACGDHYTVVIPARDITLTSEKVFSKNGNTVSVTVDVSKNCGFSYLRFTLDYDKSALTLANVINGEIIADMDSGVNLLWSAATDATATGALVTLVFEVSPYATEGDYTVNFISRECFNAKGEEVGVNFLGSSITLIDYVDGDANGDGTVNGKDIMILRKYFADLNDETGISGVKLYYGADANGDGTVDGRDLILLRQYMAYYDDETGGSEIVLGTASKATN